MPRPVAISKPHVKGFIGQLQILYRIKETTCWNKAAHGGYEAPIEKGKLCYRVIRKFRHPKTGRTGYSTHYFHPGCLYNWLTWKENQYSETYRDLSKDGRRIGGRQRLDLPGDAKEKRGKMVRERSRQIKLLRKATPESVGSITTKIAKLDTNIRDTGYPVGKYGGRRGKDELRFEQFLSRVKSEWNHPRAIPDFVRPSLDMEEWGLPGGVEVWGPRFDKWKEEWLPEADAQLAQRRRERVPTYEDQQTDEGKED